MAFPWQNLHLSSAKNNPKANYIIPPPASIATKLGAQKIINAVNYTAAAETNEQNSGVSLGAQKVLPENENENRTETKTIARESNEGG